MSDQANGQGAEQAPRQEPAQNAQTGATPQPDAGNQALSGRARTAPVIEGEAVDITDSRPETEAAGGEPATAPEQPSQAEARETGETGETFASATADAAPVARSPSEKSRKNASLVPLAALAGVAVVGVGLYFSWDHITHINSPTRIAEAPGAVTPKALPEQKADAPVSIPTEAESEKPAASTAAKPESRADADKAGGAEAPSEALGRTAEPAAQALKTVEAPKTVEALKTTEASKAAPVEPPAPKSENAPAFEATKPPAADKSAELAGKLAATELALAQVTQRVQALEAKLAAPKTESRATLSAPDALGAKTGDASARIVLAQSLLTALRQDDDFAPALAGLQNLGADPARVAKWRAGLAAPTTKKLAADFSALAPKLVAAAQTPADAAPGETKPASFGESVLAYIESRAKKLVKVQAVAGPESEAAGRVNRAGRAIDRGDLGAAVAEIAALPEKAQAVAADWTKQAQARLDAETAAKSELADAFKGLSKPRN